MAKSDKFNDDEAVPETSEFLELLGQARSGDEQAIGNLTERYREYLLFIANADLDSGLKRKFGASDVVQQTLIQAYRHFEKFHGESETEFRGWIRKIVKNRILNARRSFLGTHRRSLNREIKLNDSGHGAAWLADPRPTPQASALVREMALELEKCLSQLSESHQKVLRMRNWQEMSFEKIGNAIECSPDAARKLWFRAFQKLQQAVVRSRPELGSQWSLLSASVRLGETEP